MRVRQLLPSVCLSIALVLLTSVTAFASHSERDSRGRAPLEPKWDGARSGVLRRSHWRPMAGGTVSLEMEYVEPRQILLREPLPFLRLALRQRL